ncbi:MAG: protein phosphatase 2C domain-containing protein [Oscillospiraceae bacterium]|nr:serine/threonine-protein phosphatase [Oscillospiraceae bacterium]MCR4758921.1 protein phosphatase 2C domain-containing protein [Oscillospiraceae bacterium]
MKILAAYDTDIGRTKQVNQDALCIREAETNQGLFHMSVLCDGMGGFSCGEVASATVVRAFADWFQESLPKYMLDFSIDTVWRDWKKLAEDYSRASVEYGLRMSPVVKLGTTLTAVLITEQFGALCIQLGDSRLYRLTDSLERITQDQTKIAVLMRQGQLTLNEYEEEHHPERNILSDCIGGSRVECHPDFYQIPADKLTPGTAFMLCSDGFRHEVSSDELYTALAPENLTDEGTMKQIIRRIIDLNMERNETDNISAILLKII